MKTKLIAFSLLIVFSHPLFSQIEKLRESINEIVKSKKAKIGVAIWGLESKDTVSINGNTMFPMFSVVKFYTALAVLNQVDKGTFSLDTKVSVKKSDLNPNTYSPMRDSMLSDGFDITIGKLIHYSVTVSDNIAYEKLAELMGGIKNVNAYIQKLGVKNIAIVSTIKKVWNKLLKTEILLLLQ